MRLLDQQRQSYQEPSTVRLVGRDADRAAVSANDLRTYVHTHAESLVLAAVA